ncbi:MAG: MFS transporter [Bacilli bacterium]|nr:MFS transporter [Bacilli bacterium]MDY6430167.1 MFS transporter [Bacilli bacterium]
MEKIKAKLKLNYKRTCIIGFAFFGILLLWQVFDSNCSLLLEDILKRKFNTPNADDVAYLVGLIMAMDNLAALIMMPLFGMLSDKTKSPIGKRMPYILGGTLICAIFFPLIPFLFYLNNLAGMIVIMGIVVFFAMMYRNPAVALMPDITPKPLRSNANGIINVMGYLGGAIATVLGIFLDVSKYLGVSNNPEANWQYQNFWVIEIPFLVASVLIVVSTIVLFFLIKENKLQEELRPELELGESMSETEDKPVDNGPISKKNLIALLLILGAEFLWFMSDNSLVTFMANYTKNVLYSTTGQLSYAIIVGGALSVVGFLTGGLIASKIGRKWTIVLGLVLTVVALGVWYGCAAAMPLSKPATGENALPFYIFIAWGIKGYGMALVHTNSLPMVVELCTGKKVGRYTGFYYISSMLAQTITPTVLGLILLNKNIDYTFLPIYSLSFAIASLIVALFIKNVRIKNMEIKKGLAALDVDD